MNKQASLEESIAMEQALPCEDTILAYTHSKRKEVVESLTQAGIPSDQDNVKILLGALKDMDHSALTRKRIKTDEKAIDTGAMAADLISRVLTHAHNTPKQHVIGIIREAPKLPDHLPIPDTIDGEMDIEAPPMTFDQFMIDQNKE